MFLRGGGDIKLLRCGDVEANPGPDPEPSTSRPSASLRQTRISTPRKSSQSAKDPSLSEVMAMLNSINSSLNSKMDGMNTSLNDKMDGVKEDVGQLHQEFGTLSELEMCDCVGERKAELEGIKTKRLAGRTHSGPLHLPMDAIEDCVQ
ncbi:hypothetical protein ACOMHN_011762 [Nucella lapillus]